MTYIQGNQHTLIGIHSRNTGVDGGARYSTRFCGQKTFSVRVTSVLDWIDTILNADRNEAVFCVHGKNAADP